MDRIRQRGRTIIGAADEPETNRPQSKGPYKQIEVSFNLTANLGNYQSARVGMGITRDIVPGENIDEALSNEFSIVFDKVMESVEQAQRDLKDR